MSGIKVATLGLTLVLGACAPQLRLPGPPSMASAIGREAFTTPDGLALPMRRWLPAEAPPKAVIVALHGMNDYSNAFTEAGTYLAKRGFAVYAYDQRGFGQAPHAGYWSSTRALADDVSEAARRAADKHPGAPLYLLGESMGGAVAMLAMTGPNPPPAQGLILSAPAVWGRSTMNVFERAGLWVFSSTLPGMKLSGKGLNIQASDNVEMLRALGRDPLVLKETRVDAIEGMVDLMDEAQEAARRLTVPTLVLYGEKDEIIPPKATYAMLDRLPPGSPHRLAIYRTGWHLLMRDLGARTVLDDIVAWIESPVRRLPSGADQRAEDVMAERKAGESGMAQASARQP